MGSLSTILLSAATQLFHRVRDIAYEDMERQAYGWIPEAALIEKVPRVNQPITIDFNVPNKNRLDSVRRRIIELPR